MPTFFINGTNLSNSTAVFLDSEQLICAPDGYYSDGIITREQVGCSLLPQIACPNCAGDCPIGPIDSVGSSLLPSFYTLSLNLGFGTGAVIVKFNPRIDADGIIAELNGLYYNELSSPVYGYLAAPPNLPTYVGSSACFLTGFNYSLQKRVWNGTTFALVPGYEVVNVVASQVQVTPSPPNNCVMVIPKTSGAAQTINVYMYIICANSIFDIEISCAEPLPSFQASDNSNPSFPEFCTLPIDNTFYVAKVNNTPAYPLLAVNDWVFQDENGEFKLADGYYKTNDVAGGNNTIEVVNGVIVAITFSPCD